MIRESSASSFLPFAARGLGREVALEHAQRAGLLFHARQPERSPADNAVPGMKGLSTNPLPRKAKIALEKSVLALKRIWAQ